jgi:hypothetical protein
LASRVGLMEVEMLREMRELGSPATLGGAMKTFLGIVLLACISINTLALTRRGMTHVVDITDYTRGGLKISLRKIDADEHDDDKEYRSKKPTDLKVLVVNKGGDRLEEYFLNYKLEKGLGADGRQQKRLEKGFVSVKGGAFLFLKKSKAAHEVQLFHKYKLVASEKFGD